MGGSWGSRGDFLAVAPGKAAGWGRGSRGQWGEYDR